MPLQCPDCGQALSTHIFRGVQIDSCPRCAGIWFDSRELGRVMKSDPLALLTLEATVTPSISSERLRRDPGKPRQCPVCHVPLHRFRYHYESQIELDTCASCHGLWVEDGKLARIQRWLDEHPQEG